MARWSGPAKYALAVAWTFAPMLVTERLADYFFLTDNTGSFYFMSGWRLIIFIASALVGSLAAGALLRDTWRAAATQWVALLGALGLFFYSCDPRVCFSTGIDGLEPLRLGYFLGSVAFSGAALGAAVRGGRNARSAELLAGFFAFAAVGFYPVMFTMAGTRLLPPLHPWVSAAILGAAGFAVSVSACMRFGPRFGVLAPVGSMFVLVLLSSGMAVGYLPQVAVDMAILALALVGAALAGSAASFYKRRFVEAHRSPISSLFAVALVIVLSMMLFTTPDAVNGVVPAGGSTTFAQGVPLYAGGAMYGPAGHARGVGATVGFGNTDPAVIDEGNFLSTGIGVHAAGCCVDGIDYSYRYDVYLFHSGQESMVAGAWEVCDDNAACGGHSWKDLIFFKAADLGGAYSGRNLTLRIQWGQGEASGEVLWSYSEPGGPALNFTSFRAPSPENRNFNTGVLPGGTTSGQNASYFFQFGVMGGHSVGRGGWEAYVSCPSVLVTGWSCIDHAITLTGSQSYWKIFWRWGEDYPGVSVVASGPMTARFSYSGSSTPSFEKLW